MTLQEAINEILTFTNYDTFWSTNEIKDWINDGYMKFFTRKGIDETWTADINNTDEVPMPERVKKVYSVYFKDEGENEYVRLTYKQYKIFDNYIHLYDTLTGKIKIEGSIVPTRLTSSEEKFELPEEFQEGIIDYAKYMVSRKDEDDGAAQFYYQAFLTAKVEWEQSSSFRYSEMEDNWYGGFGGGKLG